MLGQITLTNNVGNTPIETDMFSCESDETWMRVFKLSDFGIASNEQFVIKSGQVALSQSNSGAHLQFRIYSIDDNFPNYSYSLYPLTLLGTRGIGTAPVINGPPEIIQLDFEESVIVPAGTERILVAVEKYEDFYNPESAVVIIAGTEEDTGVSWYYGCDENYGLTPTTELTNPVPDANFFINVTGEVFDIHSSGSTTRLSHNICDDVVKTGIFSCSSAYIYWSRAFTLTEFGISTNEEFVIKSGQVAIDNTGWLPEINFNIYRIDDNFPSSFSETDLIGSSQYQELQPSISNNPQIIEVVFDTPIIIPADVERILVEVHKGIVYGDALAFIAGSTQDNDVSWQRGCIVNATPVNGFVTATDMGYPNANFYINVTGNVNHVTNNFEMNISNVCSEFLKEFSVEDQSNIFSVVWDFGDVASGVENTSIDLSPFHDFSADGIYTITATVTANDGSIEVISETIDVKEPPNAYGINNVYACEDDFNTGISSSFDVSTVTQQVLGGQIDKVVTFIDGNNNEYDSLPNPFTNTVSDIETIRVRVSYQDNLCCYSETTFNLIVQPLPEVFSIADIFTCDDDNGGFSNFDLNGIESIVLGNQTGMTVEYYDGNGNQLPNPLPNPYINSIPNQETITARVINDLTDCYNETTFILNVNELPVANPLETLISCDDNNDGISEYFDTSLVESIVLGNQTGMEVSYYDNNGAQLPSPLPNPFTNSQIYNQNLTVRVTNSQTSCFYETILTLETSSQPSINQPLNLYACDEGNGFGSFNTSILESELIGSQTGLLITYMDNQGNVLPSPLPTTFQNTSAYNQTIFVKVENELSSLCFSETSFELIINELPSINLEPNYFICNLDPSIPLSIDMSYNTYQWQFEDENIISTTHEANIVEEGNYVLTVARIENGITCENSFTFHLTRSILPSIQEVKYDELGNNYIEIIVSGDGDFEYSIDGIDYQDSNYFGNISGGIYNVFVRDKEGCGEDSTEVAIVDYPKFFTPNNDGYNDNWQIKGLNAQLRQSSKILIFDRYGKLLKQLDSFSKGWDGTFNGAKLPTSDYWFTVDLNDGRTFQGHFTLKR
jgi:gliding motility-associated-like protein